MSALCQGICKGQRSSGEGPAKYGTQPDGSRVLWCPCCGEQLVNRGVEPNAPNLTTEGRREFTATRFEDVVCEYYTVSLSKGPTTIGTTKGGLIT